MLKYHNSPEITGKVNKVGPLGDSQGIPHNSNHQKLDPWAPHARLGFLGRYMAMISETLSVAHPVS